MVTLQSSAYSSLTERALLAAGIYHGTLNFESSTDDLIDSAQLLPYPPHLQANTPLSMVMTKFHFMLLYKDHFVGICNLNEKTTYEVPLVSTFFPSWRSVVFECNSQGWRASAGDQRGYCTRDVLDIHRPIDLRIVDRERGK